MGKVTMRLTQLRQADLNLLVYFIALVEEKTISRAAKRLRLSQPAVSRSLQRLRELFRDDLLVRRARKYELTPRGQALLQELTVILPQLERLISGKEFDPSTEQAAFRLAASDSLAQLYGSALAIRHAERHNLDFLFQAYTDDRFSDLEANRFDLLLDAEFRALPATLKSEVLFEEELVCAVDKESPYREKLSLAQYVAADHVCISVLENQQAVPDLALTKVGAARRCAFTLPYFSVGLNMVAGTSLIATLPRKLAERLVNPVQTRLVSAPDELGSFRYLMIWHSRQDGDVRHLWLRQSIRDATTQTIAPNLNAVGCS